jgi:hypothetical protein
MIAGLVSELDPESSLDLEFGLSATINFILLDFLAALTAELEIRGRFLLFLTLTCRVGEGDPLPSEALLVTEELFCTSFTKERQVSLLGRINLACVFTGVINLVDWCVFEADSVLFGLGDPEEAILILNFKKI